MYGPIHDETSIGALSTFKMGMMGAVAVAVLALFIVVRHTRTEEETGRLELLGATVVGRRAPLTAALLVAGGASLVAGVGTALGLIAVGMPTAGSLVMGLGFACLGIAFAAVAGFTAQLDEERADRRRLGRCRPRRLLPAAGDRRCLGRRTVSVGCRGRRRSAGGSRPGRMPETGGGSSLSCSASPSRCLRWPTRSRRGGISPRVSCRIDRGPPRQPRACGVPWHWPGACSAAASSPGRRRSSWSAWWSAAWPPTSVTS